MKYPAALTESQARGDIKNTAGDMHHALPAPGLGSRQGSGNRHMCRAIPIIRRIIAPSARRTPPETSSKLPRSGSLRLAACGRRQRGDGAFNCVGSDEAMQVSRSGSGIYQCIA